MEVSATLKKKQDRIVTRNYSPLRYPGGKGKLCAYIKRIIEANELFDCEYVEPYAGGAAVALELLAHEYILSAHINDVSRPIFAFWNSVLNETEAFCKLLTDTRVSIRTWDRQKNVFQNAHDHDDLQLGFATFFLNRTNRSGILNAGIIGGRRQQSEWGIEARYNKKSLLKRIRMVSDLRERIRLTKMDASDLIGEFSAVWKNNSLIYFDPPYYNKGKHLYFDFYEDNDHKQIARKISSLKHHRWMVSYDNDKTVREHFHAFRSATYDIGYSAREHTTGSEVMFFSPGLSIPQPCVTMKNFVLQTVA
jgi:DNA adenine methylase